MFTSNYKGLGDRL